MMHKTWNARDQTKEELQELLRKKYREMEIDYRLLRKISDIETAKKMIDEIWQIKSFANDIETELLRREYNNGETK